MVRAAKAVGNANGPSSPQLLMFMTLQWSKNLYQWYLDTPNAPTPFIVSADDVMTRPDIVRKLCVETGMDPDALQYEWETREVPAHLPIIQPWVGTVFASKGILPGYDSKDFDLDKKKEEWKEEWGDEEAEFLARKVTGAMEVYEWMMERRIQA